jgi:predicted dehydrogenase
MTTIALIGAGNIGTRHLQALVRLGAGTRIVVVDPAPESRALAAARAAEVGLGGVELEYLDEPTKIAGPLDVAIVATSSDVRRAVVEALFATARPRHLVLEKVLFQRRDDYAAVQALVDDAGARAWVNCPRRLWPGYAALRDRVAGAARLQLTVSGGDWGLASNAVHFLDLLAFLGGDGSGAWQVGTALADRARRDSRRPGFRELTGTLVASAGDERRAVLTSLAAGTAPLGIEVLTERGRYLVREGEQRILSSEAASQWAWREDPFVMAYQSQLSDGVVRALLDTGGCALTPLDESTRIHLPLIDALCAFFDSEDGTCPIT